MVNVLEWLDKKYPKEQRSEITELDIWNEGLEGNLNLNDFPNLKKLGCCYNNKLTSLDLSNCEKLEKINCWNNQLTSLILPKYCPNLTELHCSNNRLTSLNFSSLNPEKLKKLDIGDNNFSNSDLSIFSSFINLEVLRIGDDDYPGARRGNIEQNIYNRFLGSLEHLKNLVKLQELGISNTDINEMDIEKLPKSLKEVRYYTHKRPNCKLTEIVPLLNKHFGKFGRCLKCELANTSKNWCQPCAEKEWGQLSGRELVEKFIQQQPERYEKKELKWIPYEQFTNVKYLAGGGFGKIYIARWGKEWSDYRKIVVDKMVALKSLNGSQNITFEFLTEIANTNLIDGYPNHIVKCHGISQDPETKNYVMVMNYMKDGNLRQYLKFQNRQLRLDGKLDRLIDITNGLKNVHDQNLVHRDFHSGNILNNDWKSYISDLGLSQPANYQKQEGQIFGVLPYIAPEVLQGQSYTQKSDIYSFGIVIYELLINSYPYANLELNDMDLALKICQGLRPDISKIPMPQLLKDLIIKCWDADPEKRPSTEELVEVISDDWLGKESSGCYQVEKNTLFRQQYQALKDEYNLFSKNTYYQIHPTATTTSKMIDTNEINRLLSEDFESCRITDAISNQEQRTGLTKQFKRQLTLSVEDKKDTKEIKLEHWTNIHPNFTPQLIHQWQSWNFTHSQVQEWIAIGLTINDANFCAWLRDNKGYTSEQVLNHGNLEQLNQEYFQWRQEQQQTNIEIPPRV